MDFYSQIDALIERLHDAQDEAGYSKVGAKEKLVRIVEDARHLLAGDGELGPWEQLELGYADAALANDFCMIAVVAIGNAIEVNDLEPDEYKWGFNQRSRELSAPPAEPE
jgi:hypothetical protein